MPVSDSVTPPDALVVTSIAAPNAVLRALAEGSIRHNVHFYNIGDSKTPAGFALDGCDYYPLERQRASGLAYAALCPERSYTRKNIGYLLAIRDGARVLIETDDDNFPRDPFWLPRQREAQAPLAEKTGWLNAYGFFSDALLWPRGLPLDAVQKKLPELASLPLTTRDCPIQQGLADENPDVDAIYRLLLPLPQNFRPGRVILGDGAWCPFNSQNTTWWAEAFPLLYLPAHCSFRMTDIWRSFVAQRIAWANGWSVLFHEATVWQERNDHNLMRDFQDEVPGYLHNRAIGATLDALPIEPGVQNLGENLRRCYTALVGMGVVGEAELPLLEAWLGDLDLA
jgi:hypothetical protein